MHSLPLQILLRALGNIGLVWAMTLHLDRYLFISGGFPAYIIIGSLLTLMNILVRPLLKIITLPLKLFATILAIVLVNGVFIWLTYEISLLMDPDLVTLDILGGMRGWIVVSLVIGFANWLMKIILK